MRIIVRVLSASALVILAALMPTLTAGAQSPAMQVEVLPNAVKVPAHGMVDVLVIARNPADAALRNVQLSWFTDAGVDVNVRAPESVDLVPYGTIAWPVQISQSTQPRLPGEVFFRIDYTWMSNEQSTAARQIVVVPLDVLEEKATLTDMVVTVGIQMPSEVLMEHRPGTASVVVTNEIDAAVNIGGIVPKGPDALVYVPTALTSTVTLSSHETRVFSFQIVPTDSAQPGEYLLLFEVAYSWQERGRTYAGTALASNSVDVGILGESALLTAVGVPSFLLLPGFLFFVTVGLFWRLFYPKTEFPLKVTTPDFWLAAVSVSVVAARVYPVITRWRGAERDYLRGYGLQDVFQVWLGSVCLGALAYLISVGGYNLVNQVKRWNRQRKAQARTPSARDSPTEILRKLGRQGLTINRDRAEVKLGEGIERAFLLEAVDETAEMAWVAPPIVVHWIDNTDNDFHRSVQAELEGSGSASTLGNLLDRGQSQGLVAVRWEQRGQLTGPREVARADVIKTLTVNLMVIEE